MGQDDRLIWWLAPDSGQYRYNEAVKIWYAEGGLRSDLFFSQSWLRNSILLLISSIQLNSGLNMKSQGSCELAAAPLLSREGSTGDYCSRDYFRRRDAGIHGRMDNTLTLLSKVSLEAEARDGLGRGLHQRLTRYELASNVLWKDFHDSHSMG